MPSVGQVQLCRRPPPPVFPTFQFGRVNEHLRVARESPFSPEFAFPSRPDCLLSPPSLLFIPPSASPPSHSKHSRRYMSPPHRLLQLSRRKSCSFCLLLCCVLFFVPPGPPFSESLLCGKCDCFSPLLLFPPNATFFWTLLPQCLLIFLRQAPFHVFSTLISPSKPSIFHPPIVGADFFFQSVPRKKSHLAVNRRRTFFHALLRNRTESFNFKCLHSSRHILRGEKGVWPSWAGGDKATQIQTLRWGRIHAALRIWIGRLLSEKTSE